MRSCVVVVLVPLLSGLASAAPTPPTAGALGLLAEGERELHAMRSSRYQHETSVDEGAGRFDFDCSGFLDHALRRVAPGALEVLPVSRRKARPLAQDFFAHFVQLRDDDRGPWVPVRHARNLKPGDIVSWLKAPEKDSHNTGHVMLVRAPAYPNPERADEILVPVIDSTMSPHADDSRARGQTGLGQGLIGIIVHADGRPLRYRWRGGRSKEAVETRIAFGRLL